ncbi:histidine--tRNA ligase [Gammaproteobacteria bacterium]
MTPDKTRGIRGMHDVLPDRVAVWQRFEVLSQRVLSGYGYQEIRTPILELTELFARSIGEVTDIVEKEMFSFTDRNGEGLALRPEGTASCLRAAIEHGLLNQPRRLWYRGPMFRHERPQKGRYRQFHQVGVETFGFPDADIEIELLLLTRRLWDRLGITGLTLEINCLGLPEERACFREALVAYLRGFHGDLDEDSRRRLERNPLRVLDSKNPALAGILASAPVLADFLGDDSRSRFAQLLAGLDLLGLAYRVNPQLVRGLDYYVGLVFEWTTDSLGAQATVCAGGRYDRLAEQLGGPAMPAVGFALGIERLLLLMEEATTLPNPAEADLYLVLGSDSLRQAGLGLAEKLRDALPEASILTHCGAGSFKGQFKKADRSGARYALILGEDEWARGTVSLKPLREAGEQRELSLDEAIVFLAKTLTDSDSANA